MAEVSKVPPPSGAPEGPGKKERAAVDADKFKEAMRRRVNEVSQVDPDEQKKRKRREEAEEEPVETVMGPTTPPELVTPFSLEPEKKKVSPLEMQQGGPGISPLESAQPTPQAPPGASSAAMIGGPTADEMSDDSGFLEEQSFTEEPTPTPTPVPPQVQLPQQPATPALPSILPEPPPPVQPEETPLAVGPPETEQQPPGQGKPDSTPQLPAAATAKPIPKQKIGAAAALEGVQAKKTEQTKGFFEQIGKEKGGKEEQPPAKTPEEIAEEEAVVGYVPPSVPSGLTMPVEEEKKVEEKEGVTAGAELGGILAAGAAGEALPAAVALPTAETLPPYATLTPQTMEMFDRMVGVMTVMTLSGVSETTITLNAPQFASSVFFGTQIIIQEYSTAPKAFNIQLIGTPQAVALMQSTEDDLMAAFQAGNYNFRVNRLETGYLSERPLFKRKEKTSGEKDEEGESRQ